MCRIFRITLRNATSLRSVALLLMLCNIAQAEETTEQTSNFKIGGYSSASMLAPRKGTTEFNLNEVSLLLSWENEGRFKFFSELELERPLRWNSHDHFDKQNNYLDLERLYVDYNHSDKLNIRTGRFLTPAGRWNLLHAPPLVWTSSRPLATSFLFPNGVNGVMLFGATPLQLGITDQTLEYSVFVEGLKDQVHDRGEIVYKDVAGAQLRIGNQFNVGLSLATFKEERPGNPEYRMLGLDFITHINGWELSGEGFQRFTNGGKDGGSGAFLQSAAPIGNNWYWLTRLETFQRPQEVSGERWVLGVTKRIAPTQLLKMEFIGGSGDLNTETPRGFAASFAVLF
jgi:hypothetical protein